MSNPSPFDLSEQEDEQAAREQRAAADSEQRIADWKWLLSNKHGRRIVWALLEDAGVYRCSFTGNANSTFYAEGRRSIGLQVMATVTTSAHERYIEMMQEHKQ